VGTVLGVIALIIALVALAIAMGVSLGRQGDREAMALLQSEQDELLGQMLDRLTHLEGLHPHADDDATPPDASG
jgi:hypothetical protein